MEAKEKTLALLEADLEAAKPFLRHMLEEYNACDVILEELEDCRKPVHVKRMIESFNEAIAGKIGVLVATKTSMEDVMEYIESHDLSYSQSEEIWPHLNIDLDDIIGDNYYELFPSSLVNTMKLERFMAIIDDVTLDDLDALTAKYRPNSLEALNQMRMVV